MARSSFDPLLDLHEVARRLNVSEHTVRRLIETGRLLGFHLAGVDTHPIRVRESAFNSIVHGWEDR
jgi:excisionase family DNA binding protein